MTRLLKFVSSALHRFIQTLQRIVCSYTLTPLILISSIISGWYLSPLISQDSSAKEKITKIKNQIQLYAKVLEFSFRDMCYIAAPYLFCEGCGTRWPLVSLPNEWNSVKAQNSLWIPEPCAMYTDRSHSTHSLAKHNESCEGFKGGVVASWV